MPHAWHLNCSCTRPLYRCAAATLTPLPAQTSSSKRTSLSILWTSTWVSVPRDAGRWSKTGHSYCRHAEGVEPSLLLMCMSSPPLLSQPTLSPRVFPFHPGCPIDLVCDRSAGSSLLLKPKKIEDIARAMSRSMSCPLTLKTRKGYHDGGDVSGNGVLGYPTRGNKRDELSTHEKFRLGP